MAYSENASGEFIVECQGPSGLFGVFEDDGEAGYLYLYHPQGDGILEAHWVYNRRSEYEAKESNTEVNWSDENQEFVVTINKVPRGAIRIVD
jgi:hypothetical protein